MKFVIKSLVAMSIGALIGYMTFVVRDAYRGVKSA